MYNDVEEEIIYRTEMKIVICNECQSNGYQDYPERIFFCHHCGGEGRQIEINGSHRYPLFYKNLDNIENNYLKEELDRVFNKTKYKEAMQKEAKKNLRSE